MSLDRHLSLIILLWTVMTDITLVYACTVVFVTGNANKLKEVQAILAAGTSGITATNQAVDREYLQPAKAGQQ